MSQYCIQIGRQTVQGHLVGAIRRGVGTIRANGQTFTGFVTPSHRPFAGHRAAMRDVVAMDRALVERRAAQ